MALAMDFAEGEVWDLVMVNYVKAFTALVAATIGFTLFFWILVRYETRDSPVWCLLLMPCAVFPFLIIHDLVWYCFKKS